MAKKYARVLAMEVPAGNAERMALSKLEQELLDFERNWWSQDLPKESAIVDNFGLTAAEYYEQLHKLIDSDDALAHDPLVVRRLRRMRDRRNRERMGEIADNTGS